MEDSAHRVYLQQAIEMCKSHGTTIGRLFVYDLRGGFFSVNLEHNQFRRILVVAIGGTLYLVKV